MPNVRPFSLCLLTLLGAIAVAASTPAAASASERHASATGSGTDCTSAKPCDLTRAVEHAGVEDEVIVAPGTYPLTTTLSTHQKITVRGVPGQARPRLVLGTAGAEVRVLWGSTLRYVALEKPPGTAGSALIVADGAVEQVLAKAGGSSATAEVRNGTIRNSVVVASGPKGSAIGTYANNATFTSTSRNVTAIATGSEGVPITATAVNGGIATVDLVNVIAYRGYGQISIAPFTDSSGAQATITATHTNYQSVNPIGGGAKFVSGPGNKAEEPLFVNAAAGDYRQAPGAYTVDAGLDAPENGATDFDGQPRRIGTTDIGADEFMPAPTVVTGAAGAVTGGSARLTGSVDPRGVATSYHFEYGATSAYGHTTTTTAAGSGSGAVAAAATLAGLRPGTTYRSRLVAAGAGGVVRGAERTFTTTAPAPPAFAGVKPISTRLAYARRSITLRLACPGDAVGRCTGRTRLTARRVVLGRAPFSIAPGGQAKVRVRVTRAGRRLLSRSRRVRGKDVNVARDGIGRARTVTTAVTIRRRR